jgi:hypothetical protein
MHDEVELPIAEAVPGAGEVERGAGDLLQPEDLGVEAPGALEVGDVDADVVQGVRSHG